MNSKYLQVTICVMAFIAVLLSASCKRSTIVEIQSSPSAASKQVKPKVKVFLENSGSMDGYMCNGSELKDGIYNYLSAINNYADTMQLYYINSKLIPQRSSLNQYIHNLTPANFKQAGGDRAFSNIPQLFETFLSQISENTIGIYISDCILDIPDHAAPDFLNITRTDIHNLFTNKGKIINDLAVCVYQLESKFKGNYYYPKGGAKAYEGKRPYYMIIVGKRSLLANLRCDVSDETITHGVKNYCAFSSACGANAILRKGGSTTDQLKLKIKKGGRYYFDVLVDFDGTLQDAKYLSDVNNYEWINTTKLSIENISQVTSSASEYSHVMTLSVDDNVFSDMVQLKNAGLPEWVKASSDPKGDIIENSKTFGIDCIIGGISDAFPQKKIADYKLNIKKK